MTTHLFKWLSLGRSIEQTGYRQPCDNILTFLQCLSCQDILQVYSTRVIEIRIILAQIMVLSVFSNTKKGQGENIIFIL